MIEDTNSRILKSVHKVAKALHRVGAMDDATMQEMDRLCRSDSTESHTGSSFESFLEEEGRLAEADAVAMQRVREWEAEKSKPKLTPIAPRKRVTFDAKEVGFTLNADPQQSHIEDPARFAPGSYGCHEAMHMASVLAEMVDEQLCNHPSIQLCTEWRVKADAARTLLFELYNEISRVHL